jgi:hypothetical protein
VRASGPDSNTRLATCIIFDGNSKPGDGLAKRSKPKRHQNIRVRRASAPDKWEKLEARLRGDAVRQNWSVRRAARDTDIDAPIDAPLTIADVLSGDVRLEDIE